MTIDDQIKDEKLQYDIDKEAAKISALTSEKIQQLSKLDLLILLQEKLYENKQKRLQIKEKSKLKL